MSFFAVHLSPTVDNTLLPIHMYTHTHTHVSQDSNPFQMEEHDTCDIKYKQHMCKTQGSYNTVYTKQIEWLIK